MAESTLSISLAELRARVSHYLGYPRVYTDLDADQQSDVSNAIRSGLRAFYFPPSVEGVGGHVWSFLQIVDTAFRDENGQNNVTISAGTNTYTLPDDFANMIGDVTYGTGTETRKISIIPEVRVRAHLSGSSVTGTPSVGGIRPKKSTTAGQRWEIVLYPVPDADIDTLSYTYCRIPDDLVTDANLPLGGMMHSDTILQACLAFAELHKNDEKGHQWDRFIERLQASISIDRQSGSSTSSTAWPATGQSQNLDLGYLDYVREVGGYLGKGWDVDAMSDEDFHICDFVVQSGLRQFYSDGDWDFLRVRGNVVLLEDQKNYELPIDFSTILDHFTYDQADGSGNIVRIDEPQMRRLYSGDSTAGNLQGPPQYYAIVPQDSAGVSSQRWEVVFYPQPTEDEAGKRLTFRYAKRPAKISRTNPFPMGNWAHAETILQSCLAVAEGRFKPEEPAQREKYQRMLANSTRIDSSGNQQQASSTWPTTGTSSTLYMQYQDYAREVGGELGYGYNDAAWTHQQSNEVDFIIQSGLRQFYWPPKTEAAEAHSWEFLEDVKSLWTWQALENLVTPDTVTILDVALDTPVIGQQTVTVDADTFTSDMVNYTIVASTLGQNQHACILSVTSGTVAVVKTFTVGVENNTIDSIARGAMSVSGYDDTEDTTTIVSRDCSTIDSSLSSLFTFRENMVGHQITIQAPEGTQVVNNPYTILEYVSAGVVKLRGNAEGTSVLYGITMADPEGTYFLPPTTITMDSVLTFKDNTQGYMSIPIVSEMEIRQLRQSQALTTGRPVYAGRRSSQTDGVELQRYELLFYPTPDSDYELEYRYHFVPAKLSIANPVPVGGLEHQETILASILAVAEWRKNSAHGGRWEQFLSRLSASISKDRKSNTVESFGYNGDGQHRHLPMRGRYYDRTTNVTYRGALY